MSASTATIGRLSATIHGELRHRDRVDRLLREIAGGYLDSDLASARLPDGHWCIRRLDLRLEIDLDDMDDARLAGAWSRALAATLAKMTRAREVVHYASDLEAQVDMLVSSARRDTTRVWAWRQVGLLVASPSGPPGPAQAAGPAAHSPGELVLLALRARPALALRALQEAITEVGVAALHRILGPQGWQAAVSVVTAHPERAASDPAPAGIMPGAPALAEHIVTSSRLATAFIDGGVIPGQATLVAWAALTVAEIAPARSPEYTAQLTQRVVRLLADRLCREGGRLAVPRAGHALRPGSPGSLGQATAGSADGTGNDLAAAHRALDEAVRGANGPGSAPDDVVLAGPHDAEQEDVGYPTNWAGLLFLCATADECGIPDFLAREPRLAVRSTAWVLHQIGSRIAAAPPDDPALLAFAGLAADAEPPPGHAGPLDGAEKAAVAAMEGAWVEVTAARMRAGWPPKAGAPDPASLVASMARRPGRVRTRPGWVEVTLPADGVNIDVRRAGLDLDPGWLPWLGAVVRYCYE